MAPGNPSRDARRRPDRLPHLRLRPRIPGKRPAGPGPRQPDWHDRRGSSGRPSRCVPSRGRCREVQFDLDRSLRRPFDRATEERAGTVEAPLLDLPPRLHEGHPGRARCVRTIPRAAPGVASKDHLPPRRGAVARASRRVCAAEAGNRRARRAHQQPVQHDCVVADPICLPPTRLRRAHRPLPSERCGDHHPSSRRDEPHREGVCGREQEPRGVLVLSEMAGASKEMREAIIVNPNDVEDVVGAIHRALTMPPEEQAWRIRAMQERLRRYDARTWATRFLERLDDAVRLSEDLNSKRLSDAHRKEIRQAYRKADRRLLLFDYDGTLVSLSVNRETALPGARVTGILKGLGADSTNDVVLVSGRPRRDLEKWFGELPLTLIAEHGAWVRDRGDREWRSTLPLEEGWKVRLRPVMERFLDRVPGSSLEEKDFSIAWHYRSADVESGTLAAKDLVDILTTLTANFDLQVLPRNKVVEIRRSGVSKGTHFATHLAREPWGFILAAGDDWTDEALFASLPPSAFSIRVGITASSARLNVESEAAILDLLESLVASTR